MLSVNVSMAAWENALRAGWLARQEPTPMGRSGAVVLNTGVVGSPVDPSDVGPRGVSLPGLGPITSPTLNTGYGFLQLQLGNNLRAGM